MSGSGSLTKTGEGTLTLSGANTYSGCTIIRGGFINFSFAGNFGTGSITLDGSGLQWATGSTADISAKLDPIGANGGKFDTNGNDVTLGTAISRPGALEKTGAGTLTVSFASGYDAMTTVRDGVLAPGSGLASTQLALDGGAAFRTNGHGHSLDNGSLAVTGEGATYDGDLSAKNAVLIFIAPFNVTQPLLNITGEADVSDSKISVGLTGGTEFAPGAKLTLLRSRKEINAAG